MKATAEQIEQGKEIAKQQKVNALFVNVNGEYFTSQNHASLSVSGDKNKYTKLDYSTAPDSDLDESEELAEIADLQTESEVQAILDLELEGTGRESIITACEKRIEELKTDK